MKNVFLVSLISVLSSAAFTYSVDNTPITIVTSLSCKFDNTLTSTPAYFMVDADLQSTADGYRLVAKSSGYIEIEYKATSVKAGSGYFAFEGIPQNRDQPSIVIQMADPKNRGQLAGDIQMLNSSGLTVGGAFGSCTYTLKPVNEISFKSGN